MGDEADTPFGSDGRLASYRASCTLYARRPQTCFVASVLRQLAGSFAMHHVVVERGDGCLAFPSVRTREERAAVHNLAVASARQLERAMGFLDGDDCFVAAPHKVSVASGLQGTGAGLAWARARVGPGRPIALVFRDNVFEATFVLDDRPLLRQQLRHLVDGAAGEAYPRLGMEWWQDERRGSLYLRWRYYQTGALEDEDRRLRQAWAGINGGDLEFVKLIEAYSGGPARFARYEARGGTARAYRPALGYPG